jgi:hypothetical protein
MVPGLHRERTEKGDREPEYPENEEEPPAGTNEGGDNAANYGQAKDNLRCPDPEQRAQRQENGPEGRTCGAPLPQQGERPRYTPPALDGRATSERPSRS